MAANRVLGPGGGKDKKKTMKEEKEKPEKDFLQNVLVMVHDMITKISTKHNPEKKRLLDMIAKKAKFILGQMKASDHQHVPKREMNELIYLFNKFFAQKKGVYVIYLSLIHI